MCILASVFARQEPVRNCLYVFVGLNLESFRLLSVFSKIFSVFPEYDEWPPSHDFYTLRYARLVVRCAIGGK